MNNFLRYLKMITLMFIVVISTATVSANSMKVNEIGYGYRIIKPVNQQEHSEYFDLLMEPDQVQTISIELFNMTNSSIDIAVCLNSAKTNSNGVVVYGPSMIRVDSSLTYNIEKYVEVPDKVALRPFETKTIAVNIYMPSEKYEGYMAGGIYLKKIDKANFDPSKGLTNDYAFVIGLLLREGKVKIQPDLRFRGFSAGINNHQVVYLGNFSNITADYIDKMTVSAKIYKKNTKQALYESYQMNYRMAPNSQIAFPIPIPTNKIKAGEYTGTVTVLINAKKWEWTDDFSVSEKEAQKINNQSISQVNQAPPFWLLIIVILAVIVGLVYTLMYRKGIFYR